MPDVRGALVAWACLTLGAPSAAQAVETGAAANQAVALQADSNVEITLIDRREATFRFRLLPGANGFFGKEVMASRYRIRVSEGEDLYGAVVDRLIDVIAAYKPEAFWWDSNRLHRDVLLSTLPADRAATRHFLYRELFPAK